MKGMDAFERSVRDALQHYEVPYNSSDWNQLAERMDQGAGRAERNASTAMSMLLLAGVLSVAATSYLIFSESASSVPPPSGTGTGTEIAMRMPEAAPSAGVIVAPVTEVTNPPDDGTAAPEELPRQAARTPEVRPSAASNGPDLPAEKPHTTTIAPSGATASVTEACPGMPITFDLGTLPEDGIHLWNFGDGSFSNQPNPTHAYVKPGRYEVMLSHSSEGGGNFSNRPMAAPIVIHEAPQADFQTISRRAEHAIPSVHFENRSKGGKEYHWDFGDGNTSTLPHPDHVYRTKGTYTATLTVTNANGCVDRAETRVVVEEDYNLHALTAFSPNGDGVNDTFMPEALRHLGLPFKLSIFDATTGQLMFTSEKTTDRWNGRVDNTGDPCPVGDYVWVVEFKDGVQYGGFNGKVSLVR